MLNLSPRTRDFLELMRFNKPVGTLLLLWPTLWALWIAAEGIPSMAVLIIFVLGVIVMRAAGCVINDYADREVDGSVTRTRNRPLVEGRIDSREALILFACLCLSAFFLVLMTNRLTIALSFGGVAIATIYPFVKRHSHLPQVVLGAAWGWSIPMAYAAQTGTLVKEIWVLYFAVVLWAVVFDTFYGMVDRDDDLKVGIKSTAILFGDLDLFFIGVLQALTLLALVVTGDAFKLGMMYFLGVLVVALLFIYQQIIARHRERAACFKAFRNNQWVGFTLFIALVFDRALN
ncbi:MAG: 4-hydroxybenzoate octaprenyltransferase [Porticoccaceae bacterium]|nr:4-hydroxybenzoate octaprenyltransferase [Porticoccaceae bacterium]